MNTEAGVKLYKRGMLRFAEMKPLRRPFEDSWKGIIELLRPDLSIWDDAGDSKKQGRKRNLKTYNATPQHDLLIWRDGLLGRVASPGLDWFYYQMRQEKLNELPGVKDWLRECKIVVMNLMKDSNYYSHVGYVMLDGGSLGCGPGWIEKNKDGTGIACDNFHPREIFIGEDSEGIVNQWCRGPFELTALQAVEKFGKDKLSNTLMNDYKDSKNVLDMYGFMHYCMHKSDPIFKDVADLPDREWISFYLQCDTDADHKVPVKIGGDNTKPFSYWRMFETPGSSYSLGLGSFALVDIYGLNQITRSMLRAGHMAVEPPVFAATGMKGKIHIKPGGKMFGERTSKPELVYDGGKYPFGADQLDRQTAVIHRWFDVDFFLRFSQADKVFSATHDLQVANERAIVLGPKIGRLQRDKFHEDHERIFALAKEMDMLPPPPPILVETSDNRLDVMYNGLLDRAQRQYQQIEQMDVAMSQYAKILEVAPRERHRLKWDRVSKRILSQGEAFKEDEIATDEEYEAAVQAEIEQEQAQQLLEAGESLGKSVPGLQKSTDPTSPLAAIAGAGQEQG